MSKRFKSTNNKRNSIIISIVIFLLSVYLLYNFSKKSFLKFKIYKSNDNFINNLISSNNHLLLSNKNLLFNDLVLNITNFDIKKPVSIIKENINFNTYYLDNINKFILDPKDVKNPIIYLYSSNYDKEIKEKIDYDINSNNIILYTLKGLLDNKNIETIIPTYDIKDLIELNNKNSYEISKLYLKEYLSKYDLKLILDIEIGSNDKITIKDKDYSKMNFVIDTSNSNYASNLEIAHNLSTIISKKYSSLLDDIIKEEKDYNQSLDNKILLIRIGNENSTLEEIYNTLDVLAESIKEYIGEIYG